MPHLCWQGSQQERSQMAMVVSCKRNSSAYRGAATRTIIPVDIYSGYVWLLILAPGMEPSPKDIGFLFYPTFDFPLGDYPNMPLETEDLRAFLTAAFLLYAAGVYRSASQRNHGAEKVWHHQEYRQRSRFQNTGINTALKPQRINYLP